ncbi:MAG: type II secretion system F family protein [Bryobacteraceae bacterium]
MLLAGLVFGAVFLIAVLIMIATGSAEAEASKRTMGRLNVALASSDAASPEETLDFRKREMLSAIPLLNRLLTKLELSRHIRKLLARADSDWTPGTVVLLVVAIWLAAVFLLTLKISSIAVACLIALVPAASPIIFLVRKRDKRFRKFEEGLPAALDLMVTGLRAGHSIVSALDLVGRDSPYPIGHEFRICFEEQNFGLELRDALTNLADRIPLSDVKIIVTAILVQKETGGNLAEVLDKCAHLIRDRFRLKREIRIKTAQGRLTGWILSLLPPGLGFLLYLVHPEVISLLWSRPSGVKLLWIGSGMTITGALIISRIVRIKV